MGTSTCRKHLLAEDILESELARWNVHCFGLSGEKSITQLLCHPIFFSNIRELLCILVVLSVGSAETETSFSCLRQIHSWLRTTMTDKRLGNLRELAIQRFDILLNVDKIYVYVYLHIWCMYSGL